MKRCRHIILCFLFFCLVFRPVSVRSEFLFQDDRVRGDFSTKNLDAIIDEYELFDGWYWTTEADITQDFHGHPECPGWTSTAEKHFKQPWKKGWYGCRWPIDHVRKAAPDRGGYAECFAFAQFIGYLLSGEINPQGNWDFFYTFEAAGDLRVGDIIRTEYKVKNIRYNHSAVIYAIEGDDVRFMQVSGGSNNRISIGMGFTDGYYQNVTSIDEIRQFRGVRISRYIPEKNVDTED